jgi:endonuclease YncB( thermonuclease family)
LALVVALTLSMWAGNAGAQTVVDGDTIKLKGTTWRLWGIDAPESRQWCGHYPAGARATEILEQLMRGKTITCEVRGADRYARTIGLCRANAI